MDVFRVKNDKGEWMFFGEGTSIAMDENDDEYWPEWKSELFPSIAELLDASSIKRWFLAANVSDLHPDHREELLNWARSARKNLQSFNFFEESPTSSTVTAEMWVDGHSRFSRFCWDTVEKAGEDR